MVSMRSHLSVVLSIALVAHVLILRLEAYVIANFRSFVRFKLLPDYRGTAMMNTAGVFTSQSDQESWFTKKKNFFVFFFLFLLTFE
jgi:hypothetical protein